MREKAYGQWAASDPPIAPARADHILGCQLQFDKSDRPDTVTIQYQAAGAGVRAVEMDYANALFLLSALKSMQLDVGTPFPDDPRAR